MESHVGTGMFLQEWGVPWRHKALAPQDRPFTKMRPNASALPKSRFPRFPDTARHIFDNYRGVERWNALVEGCFPTRQKRLPPNEVSWCTVRHPSPPIMQPINRPNHAPVHVRVRWSQNPSPLIFRRASRVSGAVWGCHDVAPVRPLPLPNRHPLRRISHRYGKSRHSITFLRSKIPPFLVPLAWRAEMNRWAGLQRPAQQMRPTRWQMRRAVKHRITGALCCHSAVNSIRQSTGQARYE